jgi:hypothetical protein
MHSLERTALGISLTVDGWIAPEFNTEHQQ